MKLRAVNMSASFFLVSTWLIWVLGSKLILSNNQSDATLWVLDMCLIIGLHYCFIVIENVQLRFTLRSTCVWDNVIQI